MWGAGYYLVAGLVALACQPTAAQEQEKRVSSYGPILHGLVSRLGGLTEQEMKLLMSILDDNGDGKITGSHTRTSFRWQLSYNESKLQEHKQTPRFSPASCAPVRVPPGGKIHACDSPVGFIPGWAGCACASQRTRWSICLTVLTTMRWQSRTATAKRILTTGWAMAFATAS